MNYPVWEIPQLGGGMLIGMVAIFHVFISHFAVGGGLFLVLTERKAYRERNDVLLAYVKSHSKFFALLTLVFGALSGVGIWFSIGLVSPPGTSALIHLFVWGWAAEWVFFLVEITAALLYYTTWDRLDRRTHEAIGWIYALSAWMSLVIINGILSFMLTPGGWLEDGSILSAFFNPSYLPSLIIRTLVCLALAGLYAMGTASLLKQQDLRENLIRYSARWLMPAFLLLPFAGAWYVASIPPLARQISMGGAAAVTLFAVGSVAFSILLFVFAYLLAYRHPRGFSPALAALFLVLGLMTTGVTEWVREAVRKPYLIYGYMYSNGMRAKDLQAMPTGESLLAASKWSHLKTVPSGQEPAAGHEVFRIQCAACHTLRGYNGIALLVDGWDEDLLADQIQHLDMLKGFMPPFKGSNPERLALAKYLFNLEKRSPVSTTLEVKP